jgi:hypothetical protein
MKEARSMRRKAITLLVVVMLSATALGQSSGGSFQIVSHVVAGGGGLSTDGGNLSLDGTINGTSAGSPLSHSPFTLTGGFWPPLQILAPFCVPGDGSSVPVGSTVRCYFVAAGTNVSFGEWSTDGFAPISSNALNKIFHTEKPGPASITVTWFDENGGHIEMFHFTIERGHQGPEK